MYLIELVLVLLPPPTPPLPSLPTAGLYCCLELDEYGKFERKARTLPTNTDGVTLETTWDQDFELELVGSHNMKVLICSKSLLKEETHAHGKIRVRARARSKSLEPAGGNSPLK